MSRAVWRRLWWLGFLGLVPLARPEFGVLRVALLFFLAPLVGDLLSRRWRAPGDAATAGAEPTPLPVPGPARRFGAAGTALRYQASTLLALLNPWQLAATVRQLVGDREARRRWAANGRDPGAHRLSVAYRPPFDGTWTVMNGGETPETSHSWELVGQRYALDLVVCDDDGARHVGAGARVEDYRCYGRPILAPADGVVVAVRDGIRDATPVGTGWVDWRCRDPGGNAVTIRHAEHEYSHAAHLVPGSIPVRPGDRVRGGEPIGRCGNSGHSTEPHLHFQFQDHPSFHRAASLPVRLDACRIEGEEGAGPCRPRAGARLTVLPG